MAQVSQAPTSPEYPPAPESGEVHELGRKKEALDLGVGIETAPEVRTRLDDHSQAVKPQAGAGVAPVLDLPTIPLPPQDVLERIRTRLFSGIDYKAVPKEELVNHLLITHHMDIKLAYDLVEFLRLDKSPTQSKV